MRKNNFFIAIVLLAITTINCKKIKVVNDNNIKTYNIIGRLLESTSNPIPVANKEYEVSQKTDFGLLGSQTGFNKKIVTNSDGTFLLSYTAEKGKGSYISSFNTNKINFYASTIYLNVGSYFDINFLPALKDTNIGDQYVIKNIQSFVHRIRLNGGLAGSDTITFTYKDLIINYTKTIIGPKPIGSIINIDTITAFKTSNYNFINKKYITSASIKKSTNPNFYSYFYLDLNIGDETYKEWILDYNF